ALLALATEEGFAQRLAQARAMRGWGLAELGRTDEGIAELRAGLDGYRATGAELSRPYFLTLLAEAHARAGGAGAGLEIAGEGLAAVEVTGGQCCEAELHRVRAELLLGARRGPRQKGRAVDAEACLARAIAVARRQEAKTFELRAVLASSRLLQ